VYVQMSSFTLQEELHSNNKHFIQKTYSILRLVLAFIVIVDVCGYPCNSGGTLIVIK